MNWPRWPGRNGPRCRRRWISSIAGPKSSGWPFCLETFRSDPALVNRLGRQHLTLWRTIRGLAAFALIILSVILRKRRQAREVMIPRIRHEIARSGANLIPVFSFLALALGLLVVGVTLTKISALKIPGLVGNVMDTVIVQELGPLLAAMLILARVGAANVIELGTARATGEVESLEALGVDPIHYLVVPRVIGMSVGVFALTVYLILGALGSGYLGALLFFPDAAPTPGQYLGEIADQLSWMHFVLLTIKSLAFGFLIAVVTCYHGLAQPLRLDELSRVTVRAVTQGIVVCTLLDLIFMILYIAG